MGCVNNKAKTSNDPIIIIGNDPTINRTKHFPLPTD